LPPDTILAFDTSAAHCAAALLLADGHCFMADEPMAKGQAERLVPMIDALLQQAGITYRDLTAIGVGTGPGNFTGVRISVALARGLALSLGIPAIGVTRFEALAHALPRPLTVVEDARRSGIYAQEFLVHGPQDAHLSDLSSLGHQVETRCFVGSAADQATRLWGGQVLPPALPMVEAIARLAATRAGIPQPPPAPFYLRGPDAAPPSDPGPVILDA
jgi:tRNA threonylcarbamoyladenosine biosynthesis protein TsaB